MTNDANIRLECLKPAERWRSRAAKRCARCCAWRVHRRQRPRRCWASAKGDRTIPAMGGRGTPIPLCRVGAPVRLRRPRADLERGLTPGKRF